MRDLFTRQYGDGEAIFLWSERTRPTGTVRTRRIVGEIEIEKQLIIDRTKISAFTELHKTFGKPPKFPHLRFTCSSLAHVMMLIKIIREFLKSPLNNTVVLPLSRDSLNLACLCPRKVRKGERE